MERFRRTVAEVDAAQFVPGEPCEGVCYSGYRGCLAEAHVHTAGGPMCLNAGDWVVSGGGRTWVVEADTFPSLYEQVDATEAEKGEPGKRPGEYEWEIEEMKPHADVQGFAEYAATAPPEEREAAEAIRLQWFRKHAVRATSRTIEIPPDDEPDTPFIVEK